MRINVVSLERLNFIGREEGVKAKPFGQLRLPLVGFAGLDSSFSS
jgi:hypothetical protein